jgi:hypothetical protein
MNDALKLANESGCRSKRRPLKLRAEINSRLLNQRRSIMMTGSARFSTHIALTLAVALVIAPTTALAGLKISGGPEAIIVEAKNVAIQEILAALNQQFNLRYHSSVNLQTQITRNL